MQSKVVHSNVVFQQQYFKKVILVPAYGNWSLVKMSSFVVIAIDCVRDVFFLTTRVRRPPDNMGTLPCSIIRVRIVQFNLFYRDMTIHVEYVMATLA